MKGKHEEEMIEEKLLQKVEQLNSEVDSVVKKFSAVLQHVVDLNESNDYGSPEVRRRLISEFCLDIIKELDKPLNIPSSNCKK